MRILRQEKAKTLQYLLIALGLTLGQGLGASEALAAKRKHSKKHESSAKDLAAIELRNWGLDNAYDSSIEARKAWRITKGSREIVVAVIDTGIDPKHPDLKDNLWKKPGSAMKKGAKGELDFEYGWDFLSNQKNPVDEFGHGTHIAGIIGATAKAGAGVAGVAPNVSIMAIRYVKNSEGDPDVVSNSIKAIHYAIDNGANIINYSGGGPTFSAGEQRAIERAAQAGILFVAAAGNNHENMDGEKHRFYPASLGLPNMISVAASDTSNRLVESSNWGKESVDVAAPGENILSTAPNGKYSYLTGTSQGTAFVTGIAALLMAKDPSLKTRPEKIREIILKSVDKQDRLLARVRSGGRVNAYRALKLLDENPAAVTAEERFAPPAKEKKAQFRELANWQ